MKRSEFVDKVYANLEHMESNSGFELAENLVKLVEELGMLPPTRLSEDGFTGHISSVYTNSWEPENG